MSLVAIGLAQQDVAVEEFGRFKVSDEDMSKVLLTLSGSPYLDEVAVLSTCMRTEIYAVAERFHDGVGEIHSFLAGFAQVDVDRLADFATCWIDDAVAGHLLAVAGGIESPVLGETEVLGQVRRAIARAQEEGSAGPVLARLFRHAVEAGKRVRTETDISRGTTSVAHAAVDIASSECGGSLSGAVVVVIGAGEVGSGVVRALDKAPNCQISGTGRRVLLSRTLERSRALASSSERGWEACAMSSLQDLLGCADVVIVAAGAREPVLTLRLLADVVRERHGRPLLVMDLGVPRNVEPAVGALPGVALLDLDDVHSAVGSAVSGRRREIARVRAILDEEMERYRVITSERSAAPLVKALRQHGESIRRSEMERYRSQLARLPEGDQEVVDALTRSLVAKLLHTPTVRLKEAAATSRGERLMEALRSLFDL